MRHLDILAVYSPLPYSKSHALSYEEHKNKTNQRRNTNPHANKHENNDHPKHSHGRAMEGGKETSGRPTLRSLHQQRARHNKRNDSDDYNDDHEDQGFPNNDYNHGDENTHTADSETFDTLHHLITDESNIHAGDYGGNADTQNDISNMISDPSELTSEELKHAGMRHQRQHRTLIYSVDTCVLRD